MRTAREYLTRANDLLALLDFRTLSKTETEILAAIHDLSRAVGMVITEQEGKKK